jgi:hypothetical protein
MESETSQDANQPLTSEKSRPSLPSTLKISEEEFSIISDNAGFSSSRHSLDIGSHGDK